MLDDYPLKLPIRVRFCETDLLGHVNNAVYLVYFEAGRLEYWIAASGNPAVDELPFILARTEVDFLAEVRAREELTLGVRVGRMGNKSFDLEYEIVRDADGAPVARGRSVQVMFDYESRTTQPLSDEVRAMIKTFEERRRASPADA